VPILRPASGALVTALAAGNVPYQADLFTLSVLGASTYHWTSWDSDLTVSAQLFASNTQFFQRGQWRVVKDMEVPTLEVTIFDTSTAGFTGIGTPRFRTQVINGLLDGAGFLLQRVYMPTPGDTATYGTVDIFSGDVGQAVLSGAQVLLKIRGKNSRLNVDTPSIVYQPGCIHTFCDAGCTLSPASFTNSFTVIGSPAPTRTSVSFTTTALLAPVLALFLVGGTVTMTSGATILQKQLIIAGQVVGGTNVTLTLANALTVAPTAGDTFNGFQGCDKTVTRCTAYGNLVNFLGIPFIPRPATAAVGQ
jgi:uncharacterized phage protein (TIGR02218 family)